MSFSWHIWVFDRDSRPRTPVKRRGRQVIDACRRKWKSAVVVVAIVTMCHHWTHVFDSIDGYVFLFLGNLVAILATPESAASREAEVVVVSIDDETYEPAYAARSPLDRHALHDHLQQIYEASPRLLVIDLDLSPALWLTKAASSSEDARWQQELYSLLRKYSGPDEGPVQTSELAQARRVETVLMSPFDVQDPAARAQKEEWQRKMQLKGLRFGHAKVPVEHGLVIRNYVGSGSIVGVASGAKEGDDRSKGQEDEVPKRINPRTYRREVTPVLSLGKVLKLPDVDRKKELGGKVVFFGAGYGSESDTYITPVGEIYGAEVHAAAFQSLRHPVTAGKWGSVLLELMFALAFGVVVSRCWHWYFDYRFRNHGVLAKAGLASLVGLAALLAVVFGALSVFLLRRFGWWLSPIPIGVGMVVDGFVVGSVEEATHFIEEKVEETADRSSGTWRAVRWGMLLLVVAGAVASILLGD